MDDFASLEKSIVRELSCRLCLCTDVVRLKPLNGETKRKIKKIFGVVVRSDDSLPKAICHDCLRQLTSMHLYAVKVDKAQKFLEFQASKNVKEKEKSEPITKQEVVKNNKTSLDTTQYLNLNEITRKSFDEHQKGDVREPNTTSNSAKSESVTNIKFKENTVLEEITPTKDEVLLNTPITLTKEEKDNKVVINKTDFANEIIDPIVIIDGKPAVEGAALDKQITLFYKMECYICHELDLNFKSLMNHYRDKHGVPGYVKCCNKKFHYFHPKKLIEHMAFHLQPNIFMCQSCHENFETSRDLSEHENNGGRTNGAITCPKCQARYPTYKELGFHILSHRTETPQCDYCSKPLKATHRKKTVNNMEDLILCTQCIKTLKNIEKKLRDTKEQAKSSNGSRNKKSYKKYKTFSQALGLSPDDETSTDNE